MAVVTAVVLNYNYSAFLGECLASIEAQTHDDLRVIVIDDCSTDDSASLIAAWGKMTKRPLTVVVKSRNRGPSHSLNLAIQLLDGATEFVGFIDSDDTWSPGKTAAQLGAFDDPSVVAVYSDVMEATKHEIVEKRVNPASEGSTLTRLLSGGTFFALNSTLVRAQSLRDIADFDESVRVFDYHLWLQLARRGVLRYVPLIAGTVRIHDGSMRTTERLAGDRLLLLARNVRSPKERRAARRRGGGLLRAVAVGQTSARLDALAAYGHRCRDIRVVPYGVVSQVPALRKLARRVATRRHRATSATG